MTVREREIVKRALLDAGNDRRVVASKLNVNRCTVDRWAATGHIAPVHWAKLLELAAIKNTEKTLSNIPTEVLRDELMRRGFVVNLTGRDI